MTNSLHHHYYALLTGRAVPHTAAKVRYIDTTTHAGLGAPGPLLAKRSKDMFCLGNGSTPEVDLAVRTATVTEFLERHFPIPAPGKSGIPADRHPYFAVRFPVRPSALRPGGSD
ncbi:probable UDP-glucose-4-epimerase [Rhodococcus wratislaviensis]|uniref:Probable UDP-glucose-4-epimerase n=1 Tax=Rhodococcus wratislaviensis TaxID=44752 RepID=A0A402CJI1_RHOWR|nr:probable UDP-glucose-4-epimerase [Rhodococcus wratislaviensis]